MLGIVSGLRRKYVMPVRASHSTSSVSRASSALNHSKVTASHSLLPNVQRFFLDLEEVAVRALRVRRGRRLELLRREQLLCARDGGERDEGGDQRRADHLMIGRHTPLTHCSPVRHSVAIEQGLRSTLVTHCAMWLPLATSWNGSQNAG